MNEFEWFDLWCEQHSQLMDDRDYPRLVRCCRQRFDRSPDDPQAVEALADAYVLNNQHQDALDLVMPYYRSDPEHPLYQHAILDVLLAMGKQVEDFPWKTPPDVLRMSAAILEECYSCLKSKRKSKTIFDLYCMFMARAYLLFSEKDLLEGLLSDGRFIVSDFNIVGLAEVSVVRKRRALQNQRIDRTPHNGAGHP